MSGSPPCRRRRASPSRSTVPLSPPRAPQGATRSSPLRQDRAPAASGAGAAATDVTTAGAEAGGGSEATFSAFEPATGAADAGGDDRGGDRKRRPCRNRRIGRWVCRFRHSDRCADRGRGWGRRPRRRRCRRLRAFERQHLLDLVSPGLMHLRPLASDIWLFPRRNRRQLGGRRHHLRRLIREHARLHQPADAKHAANSEPRSPPPRPPS